jgi:uncharacterized metal-binding protein
MYQVGQAVINIHNNCVGVVTRVHSASIGVDGLTSKKNWFDWTINHTRSATEAEILAEIQKHGWKDYSHLFVKSTVVMKDYFALQKTNTWRFEIQYNPEDTSDLKEYCEEGLIAHRIITALNLAK